MSKSGLALSTVQDELRKLDAIGLVTNHSNGYHRFYLADRKHPLFLELRRIVEMSERLPGVKCSALSRKQRSRRPEKRRRPKGSTLRPDRRGVNWNLLSRRSKT